MQCAGHTKFWPIPVNLKIIYDLNHVLSFESFYWVAPNNQDSSGDNWINQENKKHWLKLSIKKNRSVQIQSNKFLVKSLWFIPPIKMVMTGGWFMIGL